MIIVWYMDYKIHMMHVVVLWKGVTDSASCFCPAIDRQVWGFWCWEIRIWQGPRSFSFVWHTHATGLEDRRSPDHEESQHSSPATPL